MDIPPGMDENEDQCLLLKKIIYCLMQSAGESYKRLMGVLKLFEFSTQLLIIGFFQIMHD
jgi:hypothetical protein